MIIELADFSVEPGQHAAFGEALLKGVSTVLSESQGYLGHDILSCQETPGRWVLQVRWTNTEAHTVGFRQSAAFAEWRAIIGPFFKKPPHVEHFDLTHSS